MATTNLNNFSEIIAPYYSPPAHMQVRNIDRFRMIYKKTTHKEAWILTLKKCASVLFPLILMVSFMMMRHTTPHLSDKTAIVLLYSNLLFDLLLIQCIRIYGRSVNAHWFKRHYFINTPEHKNLLAEVWHSYLKAVPQDTPNLQGFRLEEGVPPIPPTPSINELRAFLMNIAPNQAYQPSQFLDAGGAQGARLGQD